MKNHFYISYNGNKRNEAENFYNSIDLSKHFVELVQLVIIYGLRIQI